MKKFNILDHTIYRNLIAVCITLSLVVCSTRITQALTTISVLDSGGSPVAAGFRWLVEEDRTYHVPLNPDGSVATAGGAPLIDPQWTQGNTLSVSFHQSYMPVVGKGTSGNSDDLTALNLGLEPDKNYFISVLPDSAYSIGGAQFTGDQDEVTVYVNNHPIPTTQITIFVHEDIAPINNAWDTGEQGIQGFSIILEDAGGKYGASAGIQSADVYGNPLCTTYNPDGTVAVFGSGCTTGADGRVTIRNLAPAKYGIIAVPTNGTEDPNNPGHYISADWVQTSTIEGTKLIDAWVKANEPPFFGEFGPPGPHVSIGFAPAGPNNPYVDSTVLTGGSTISGQVVNLHLSRPPEAAFYNGGPFPHTTPWVGLNSAAGGVLGKGVYAARANADGSFQIPRVPDGQYQLVVWDDNLDLVFGMSTVNIDENGCNGIANCNLGDVPVFQWFTRMEHHVFYDINEDGYRDYDEPGILEQNVNLRFRDGTIYQAFPTDSEGFAPFDQVFPFFSWLVAEVDFARFKATGATITVDDGGPIPFGDPWSFGDQLNPQVQGMPADPESSVTDAVSRTERGPVLTEAFQGFLGQTSVIEWGKTAYGFNENGGISGMVLYAVTRAEDDPELAAAEPWEPGIPNVTVNLYDSSGLTLLATTQTDSWDDSLPANCQYGVNAGSGTDDPFIFRGQNTDCYDGMRNWNQVRPGVFDGGYAFDSICDGGLDEASGTCLDSLNVISPIRPGIYVVEVIAPTGYEVIKSEDRNVDFGDEYTPSPQLLPPKCVGQPYTVPPELAFFPGVEAPLAGQELPLCDRKEILLSGGANAAVDFSLFTEVPIAGHLIGFILDDTANEFDPSSPQFGEKYAPPFLPVSIRDWTGQEIGRTVSDEFGVYNALVPSTFTENLAQPSGISPNMLTTCMNAKTRPDGSPDPLHNPQYSQFCYTFQYMPGSTTYLDTPVVPVAAFAGPDQNPLDCALPTMTPRIRSVDVATNGEGGGPYIPANDLGIVTGNHEITITSMGRVRVPNPAYDGVGGSERKTIRRNYRFGGRNNPGTVTIDGISMPVSSWSPTTITVQIPAGSSFGPVGGKQLLVTRANGNATTTGVTVQVGLRPNASVQTVTAGESIQDTINNAGANDLILVGPGTYNEMVIMWKPVQLQGWGAGATFIDAIKTPFEKLTAWRTLAEDLLNTDSVDLISGQKLGFGGIEPGTFFSEEGAGIFVVAKANGPNRFRRGRNRGARIDGFTISGADTGGGVVVNGFGDYLEISNLNIANNSAFYAGGIRVGHPFVSLNDQHTDARNNFVNIHHNTVNQNGGLDGAGGGIALHTGSDSYTVTNNYVCGNFTTADGAGIAHYGLSDIQGANDPVPRIADNTVIFNENFNQGRPTNGGGILIAGKPPLIAGSRSPGSGSVQLNGNLIQGNAAGAGDGGGIQLSRINGEDVRIRNNGTLRRFSYRIDVMNNIIINNVAALSGGGISIQDALGVSIVHNTIAHNDNTSTAGAAFSPGIPSESNPQPGAGIVSHAHLDLPASLTSGFSNPFLDNNIIWENRMFYWLLDDTNPDNVLSGLCPDIGGSIGLDCTIFPGSGPEFDDLAIIGTGGTLSCTNCIETGGADPAFVMADFNGNRQTTLFNPEIKTAIEAPPALDEGGNFIRLRYGPLTQNRDYHIQTGSSAIDVGSIIGITVDFDLEPRPSGGGFDIGADEVQFP
ncbi:MAG: hypothetical protein GY703_16370 [Gammaproteobacteria bacterium]|nr:hypothetical protein [Gammaproteobacteria bacterium]